MAQDFIPNEADALFDRQSAPESVDFEILLLGYQRTGVLSGCVISEDPITPDLTVDVAAGEVLLTGEQITVSEQLGNIITTGHATLGRVDLVSINSSGTVVITDGTPAAIDVAEAPAVPANSIPLAFVTVPTTDTTIEDEQIGDKRVFLADRYEVNAKEVGCVGDGVADDTVAMQAAIDLAISQDIPLFVPTGNYLVDPGLTWDDPIVRFRGAGSLKTIFRFTAVTTDGIIFGDNAAHPDTGSAGWIKDFAVQADSGDIPPATPDFKAGITFNALVFADVANLYVRNFDIGYNLTNNNYGISFYNLQAKFGKCNVGLLLQGGGSGNDLSFYNCWLGGLTAAVNIAGGVDGDFNFFGGQLEVGSGATADDDEAGTIRLGKTYEAVPVLSDGGPVSFYGVDFERTSRAWTVRAFKPISGLLFDSCRFWALDTGAAAALGLIKNTDAQRDHVTWINCRVEGTYQEKLLDLVPVGGAAQSRLYLEIGTFGNPTVNTVSTNLYARGMIDREGLADGIVLQAGGTPGSQLILDNLRLRHITGLIETSDDATVWKPLHTPAIEEAGAVTLDWRDGVVNMESTAAARVVTLPDNAAFDGKEYLIHRDGVNIVTVNRAGSDTFDTAATSIVLGQDGDVLHIVSIGDGVWKIL